MASASSRFDELMRSADLARFCVFSVIGTIALLPLLILPALIGVLVDESAMSESFAGWSASVNFAGGALAALVMAFRMHRIDLRKTAVLALVLAVIGDVVSAFASGNQTAFLAARFVAGVGAGAAYTCALAAFARFSDVERGYGIFVTLQFIVSGIGLYVLPVYSALLHTSGMFLLIASLDGLALLLTWRLPGRATGSSAGPSQVSEMAVLTSAATVLALVGFALFEAANTAQFTYTERFGVSLSLTDRQIGLMLLVASLAGIPGAFAIVVVGDRFGRGASLTLGIGIAVAGLALLTGSSTFTPYLLGGSLLGFSWAFCLPYIQALGAALDPSGSALAAGSCASTIGGAAGPALAASILGEGSYRWVFLAAIAIFVVAWASFSLSNRMLEEHRVGSGRAA
jgi:MFS family permease